MRLSWLETAPQKRAWPLGCIVMRSASWLGVSVARSSSLSNLTSRAMVSAQCR